MSLFPEYESFDALGLAALVKKNIISPRELLETAIDRIETHNPALNAVVYKAYDQALQLVDAQNIPPGPFHGVPFLLKDLIADCAGMPLVSGSRLSQERVSTGDSELVRRIKQAGLVILGKTATPEFGLSPVTEPELSGPTRNPWDLQRTPGGSSGGSATAVAARMVPMAHAGDGGGSIRIPSAFCGTFGLKISRGRAPASSLVIRIWQDMIVEHVITRSVRDSAAMLDVLAGRDPMEDEALLQPTRSFSGCLEEPLAPLRIAFSATPFFTREPVTASYLHAMQDTATLCSQLGHRVEEITPPLPGSDVTEAFLIIMAAETAASIDTLTKVMHKKTDRAQLELFTDLLYTSSNHFTAKEFALAVHTLESAARKFIRFFHDYDMLLSPTQLGPPPLTGALQPGKQEKILLEMLRRLPSRFLLRKLLTAIAERYFFLMPFTPMANITGQPAMSVPLCVDEHGLPAGMHFTARMGDEYRLLQLAAQLETAKPWISRLPSICNRHG